MTFSFKDVSPEVAEPQNPADSSSYILFNIRRYPRDRMENAMTYLFTKQGCGDCETVKSNVNLKAVENLTVMQLDQENVEALAMLAYYECVALSEKKLPILVSESCEIITDVKNITQYFEEHGA